MFRNRSQTTSIDRGFFVVIPYIFWYEVTCVSEERISSILRRTEHHNRHFHCREILISQNTAFLLQNVTYIVGRVPWLRRSVGRLSLRGARIRVRVIPCGIYGGQNWIGTRFSLPLSFTLYRGSPYSCIIWRWTDDPLVAAVQRHSPYPIDVNVTRHIYC
jgi:hypothetical protein